MALSITEINNIDLKNRFFMRLLLKTLTYSGFDKFFDDENYLDNVKKELQKDDYTSKDVENSIKLYIELYR